MKQKGRKSASQLSIVKPNTVQRPPLPDDLLPDELELWSKIVNARAPDFFDDATLPLLSEYCRLCSQVKMLADEIEKFEPEWLLLDDAVKRLRAFTGMRDQAQGRMIALARTMRLTQQSRYIPDKVGIKPKTGQAPKPWQS